MILLYFIFNYFLSTKITGQVLDEDKDIISGAMVYTNSDTTYTDFDGRFTIEVDEDNPYVKVDMISFQDHLYEWQGNDSIQITLISK